MFTQVAFLAANATSVDPDPIHRGVFIAKRVACIGISAPPAMVPPLPDPAGRTNRQLVQDHTEQDGTVCASCHRPIINPFGFPFEGYDATGALRTEDRGQAVDTASSPLIEGQPLPVADALELADALASSDSVHECYAKHWTSYAFGRPSVTQDAPLVDRLGQESVLGGYSIRDLITGLVTSPAFLTRSTEELP